MRSWEFTLLEISDKIKQLVSNRWKSQDPNLTDDNIKYYLDRWDKFSQTFPVHQRDINRLSFADVEKLIDGAVSRQEFKGKSKVQSEKNPADAIYNKNNLEIYKGDLREKCILYGKGYSWCISRADSSNLFYSYRIRSQSIFYFVFDLDKPREDPWHAVVIYVNPKNTYHVATALNTGDRKMSWEQISAKHPKLKNLQGLFKPQPLTTDEREDYTNYKKERDLAQYQQLNSNEKYKYIMFGHILSSEQQDATPNELIGAYAKNQPFSISKNTWYSRLNAGDKRKIEQTQIGYFKNNPQVTAEQFRNIVDAGIKPSEEVMLAAVTNSGNAIEHILDAGIEPSKEMLLAAVTSYGNALKHILDAGIEPSEEMLLAAVTNSGDAIRYIINAGIEPSKEMFLAAVTSYGSAIYYILDAGIEPSEELMLAAVTKSGDAIDHILDAGIEPSEEVFLASVTNHGDSIAYILDAGIKPSEEVMLAAVTKSGSAIYYILDRAVKPNEKVMWAAIKRSPAAIKYMFDAGIEPSEEMLLAAVKKTPSVIEFIPNPSEKIKKLHKRYN
jgi:hypothetical protein